MSISVVVCCSDDFDVYKMLDSIDHPDAEIIGALTPNRIIEKYFESRGYRYALARKGNHGATANAGIEIAAHDKILIVDSDCVLDPGAVKAVEDALDNSMVVNLPIRFAVGDSLLSRAIATCRRFDNAYKSAALKPGIAFRRDLNPRIGGYWYDERVRWVCDSEFLWRLRKYDIDVEHLADHAIEHRPIPLRHALRAYTAYGRDGWYRVAKLKQTTHLYPPANFAHKTGLVLRQSASDPKILLNFVFEGAYITGFSYQAIAGLLGNGRE